MSGSDSAERADLISVDDCTGPFYDALRATIPPVTRVSSVLPVAFRTVLSQMPAPPGSPEGVEDAEDAVTAAVATMPKPFRIAWEYSVLIKRADLVQLGPGLGWDEETIDAVLGTAAALPDSGTILETVPVVPPPAEEETPAP